MNVKDRKKLGAMLEKWMPFFIITCTLIGAVLGSFLYYLFQGEFPYEVVMSGLIITVIFTVIEVIKQKRKKDKVPEADERVIQNISRYFAYISHGSLAIIFISLAGFTLIGQESFPILYLWILFFAYIWIVGIGTLIIKRR
ncbi:hypothetical protein [Alkalicoccobacillus murimartini]|uniref:Magnesium-transporting ATPase (P-type) n=1 Tax=Alkalicoccobacillus murimartini TaxID=171685 RepID=A0ABT9YI71_9BACI|nr:hypothetical protein [Alkalicoccobacillus murimartini]MDQ0207401.1 magnesium-transporting ATPase (P-type) [Alkalicoccobacillus murimartini]